VGNQASFTIVAAGDSALLVQFEERIDAGINARVVELAARLEAGRLPGVRDVVPTYRSLAVYFDPLATDPEELVRAIERRASDLGPVPARDAQPLAVPVCYGGECGPDLAEVAGESGLAESDVAEIHAAVVYRVFVLGFAPGFPYMGLVDPRIAVTRRRSPRLRVPAGSVGIAARQTGIYPIDTPGGWRLIGRTPLRIFDAGRAEPFLLKAGDAVRFVPVTRDEYERWPSG
jgi:inhibitor of KinA